MFTNQPKTSIFNNTILPANEFDIYNHIQTQFTNIKGLQSFTNLTGIIFTDFTIIHNVSHECVDKLGDMSLVYIKKINDEMTSNTNIEKLKTMYDIHNHMIDKIVKFNNLTNELSDNLKYTASTTLTADSSKFTFEEIFNRYKLIITTILSDIKKINLYVTMLKK